MSFEEIRRILEDAARAEGLDKYEIYFTEDTALNVETLKDEISSFSSGSTSGVNFRCVYGSRMGVASSELMTKEELCSLVVRAKQNAAAIESDNAAVIFGGSEHYASLPERPFTMPNAAEISALALKIQKQTYGESEHVTDGTQSAVIAAYSRCELANSEGLVLSDSFGLKAAYAVAVVSKDGEASDSFEAKLGFDGTEELSKKAVGDALSKIGAGSVASGKMPVIFEGRAMRSLLSAFSSAFSGKQACLGLSLLKGKEGEKIAADCVTLVDDPHGDINPIPRTFDGEGVATYPKNVIENGVLSTLLYDLTYAAKAGKESTANGQRASYASQVYIAPYCFYIKSGDYTEAELLCKLGNGIYVTELKGLHAGADCVTGDFSIESAGFLVENGVRTRAVKGFTVAGNFFDLLKNITALADNVKLSLPDGFTSIGAPDTLVSEISIAGV